MAKLERRGCWLLIPKLETRKANKVLILNKMYEVKPTRKKSGWLICNGHSVTGGFFSIGSTSRGFIQQGELPSEYQVKIPQTSCLLRCYRIPHSNRFLCLAKPFPGNISWYYCYHWYAHPKWLSDAEAMGGSRVPVTPWVAAVGQDSRTCPRWIGSVILSSILSSTHLEVHFLLVIVWIFEECMKSQSCRVEVMETLLGIADRRPPARKFILKMYSSIMQTGNLRKKVL